MSETISSAGLERLARSRLGGILLTVMLVTPLCQASDGSLIDKLCVAPEAPPQGELLSYFKYERTDGFACARAALEASVVRGKSDPAGALSSSRLYWVLFRRAVDEPSLEAEFRRLSTEIRMVADHPLRAQARLAIFRLSELRGRSSNDPSAQAQRVLQDLNYFNQPDQFSNLYQAGNLELRESIRWLLSTYLLAWADSDMGANTTEKLYRLANWGSAVAYLGRANPDLLRYVTAKAWSGGRQLLSRATGERKTAADKFPDMTVKASYRVCADEKCEQVGDLSLSSTNDQLITLKEPFDHTDADLWFRYTSGTFPVNHTVCGDPKKACLNAEVGRTYLIGADSWARGGAKYVNPVLKDFGGLNDRISSVSYSFAGKVVLPPCTVPSQCSTTTTVFVLEQGKGPLENVSRSVSVTSPDGQSSRILPGDAVSIDRSRGAHAIQFTVQRQLSTRGAEGPNPSASYLWVTVRDKSPVSSATIKAAKGEVAAIDQKLVDYLPILLASYSLRMQPGNAGNFTPDYMGLGECLGIFADAGTETRWQRVYAPLLYLSVINGAIGTDLSSAEQRSVLQTRQLLSSMAASEFRRHAAEQTEQLKGLHPGEALAAIDRAIVSLQTQQDLSATITPDLQEVLAAISLDPDAGSVEFAGQLAGAHRLVEAAAKTDNLLQTLLFLTRARSKLQSIDESVSLSLTELTAEQSRIVDR